ncbi:hypothetical protein [Mycolicibacter heraklionensis]|uniref:hypothetical protein n=1 Tax=Mycolicibacter heraklionensis TaxID=512402 RepID=UPI0007EBD8CF|nr:hypothetical protein [Mycolicibacter heraklionensis]OBG32375.1 hypothetical protein A5671_07535 [Mycolicibacter heraklionensis]
MNPFDVARLIRFWMRKVRDLRVKLCRADALVEQLEAENTELQFQLVIAWQQITDLEAELGRVEDRRYQP